MLTIEYINIKIGTNIKNFDLEANKTMQTIFKVEKMLKVNLKILNCILTVANQ